MSSSKKILLLAQNAHHAKLWCDAHGVPTSSVVYISDETKCRGYRDPSFVIVDGFWKKLDAADIWKSLQVAMTHPLRAQFEIDQIAARPPQQDVTKQTAALRKQIRDDLLRELSAEFEFHRKARTKEDAARTREMAASYTGPVKTDGRKRFKKIHT